MILTALLLSLAPAAVETPVGGLSVGDPAPAIQVAEWIKGEPVKAFQKGQIYVVEFWATWCGPCKKSIPHLSELQKKFGDKVRFVGVSVWEKDASLVAPFVKEMGDKMAYTVARDLVPDGREADEGAMARSWMQAAKQNGIPAAFIVDGTGNVAWIGHPMGIEEPLSKVVAGTWNTATAKAELEASNALEEAQEKVYQAYQKGDWKTVVAVADEAIAKSAEATAAFGGLKFEAQMHLEQYDAAYAYAAKLVDGAFKDSAEGLNQVAWTIVDPEAAWAKKDLPLALRAAERANQLTAEKESGVIDTLAKVHFDMGHVDQAIELQKKAIGLMKEGDPSRAELQQRLDQYEQAKKAGQN